MYSVIHDIRATLTPRTAWYSKEIIAIVFQAFFAYLRAIINSIKMKKIHIVALVVIAAVLALLISNVGNLTSYASIPAAKNKVGKTVTVIAKLDTASLQYNPVKNPNYLTFRVTDSLGNSMNVAYYFEKPQDIEKSERIVLKGKMDNNGIFQIRDQSGILLKCPSKYKDNPNALKNDDVVSGTNSK